MSEIEPVRSGHVVVGRRHSQTHQRRPVMGLDHYDPRTLAIATDTSFRQLPEWAAGFARIIAFGIEGTSSYGAALTSFTRRHGHKVVIEVSPDGGASLEREVGHPRGRERSAVAWVGSTNKKKNFPAALS